MIVDSLDKLPPSAKAGAERVQLGRDSNTYTSTQAPGKSRGGSFSLWSFALGIGVALLIVAVGVWFRRRRPSLLVRLVTSAVLITLAVTLYFGLLRRTMGSDSSMLSSPQGVIEDARRTLDEAQEKRREQQRLLDEIESAR